MVREAFGRWLSIALLGALAPPAIAWGPLGHQLVSGLAEAMLSAEARVYIEGIIAEEALGDAATWPDRMRSDPSPFWQKQAGPYHYVTVPDGEHYRDLAPLPQGDAVLALAAFEKSLLDESATLAERQLALRFSIHIIQDLHQPLHVGNGEDRGGTRYWVVFRGKPVNLHRLWDTELIVESKYSEAEWSQTLAAEVVLSEARASDTDALRWIAESQSLRGQIYPDSQVLDLDYLEQHREALRERMALAGSRTAAWLNQMAARGSPGRLVSRALSQPRSP